MNEPKPGDMLYVVTSDDWAHKEKIQLNTLTVGRVGPKTFNVTPACSATRYRNRFDKLEVGNKVFSTPDEAYAAFIAELDAKNARLLEQLQLNRELLAMARAAKGTVDAGAFREIE